MGGAGSARAAAAYRWKMRNLRHRKFTRNDVTTNVPWAIQVGMPNHLINIGPPTIPAALPMAATPVKRRNSFVRECLPG